MKLKKIGMIGVDSGTIIISDPCYLIGEGWTDEDYDKEVCSDWDRGKQIKNDIGAYKAVLSSTGFGDGVYPVYAEIEDLGEFGKRVSRVIIDFEVKDEN